MSFTDQLQERAVRFLRWSEKYTKTDMVYLAGAGFWTNLNFIITSILALLISIAFANLLPQAVYGVYQYLISLSAILTAITLAGMNNAVTQSVARGNEGDLRSSIRAQLLWNIVPTLLGLLGALYYFLHGNDVTGLGLTVVAILAPVTSAFNTYSAFLLGKGDFKRMFVYALVINAAYYPVMFVVMLFVKDAVWLVFVNLATNAAATVYVYLRTLKIYKPNNQTDPKTIPYGSHLSVMNAFGTVITQLDSVLVFHFLGAAQLAVYSFATMLPERAAGAFGFIGTAAFPKFATRSLQELRDTIVSKTLRALVLGLFAALVYALIAPFMFRLLFPQYLDAVFYTQVYALFIAISPAGLVSAALQAKSLRRELYIMSFVSPVMLICLQIPLLIFYGIIGMIAARIISEGVGVLLGVALLFRAARKPEAR